MTYRVHRDGHIETSRVELELPPEVIWRAMHVGPTRVGGIEREIAKHLGIELKGVLRVRIADPSKGLVIIESDWARPSRS